MSSTSSVRQEISTGDPAPSDRLQLLDDAGQLGRNFWTLYASSFLIDLGLCLYFFLYSLFLVEHHFTEQAIGFITAALTAGTLAGTLPSGFLARRIGLRAMMLTYLFVAPICFASRTFFLQMPAQIALAFFSGAAMSIWSVCFSPTLARLTTRNNRVFGFSLFVATGIGAGALAGVIGGYLPDRFSHIRGEAHIDGIRYVLLLAAFLIFSASALIARLKLEEPKHAEGHVFSRFLLRFLLVIFIWNFSIGVFTPFANVYLARSLHLPVSRIGTIYSVSQVIQVGAVLAAPFLYRRVGLVTGIALTQLATATALWQLSRASSPSVAVGTYIVLTSLQWMGGPGIASLLMDRTPAPQRSRASAMQNIANLAAQTASAALAGRAFEHFGYPHSLAANAGIAVVASLLFYALLTKSSSEHSLA